MSYLSVHPTGNQDRHGGNQKETERFLVESKQRSELGRMAQLVEHIVHIDGVTGSSPVATTTRLASLLVRFFLTLPSYAKGCESHGEIRLS